MNQNQKNGLCLEILQNCRNELYHFFPYLDGAFSAVVYRESTQKESTFSKAENRGKAFPGSGKISGKTEIAKSTEKEDQANKNDTLESRNERYLFSDGEAFYYNCDGLLKDFRKLPVRLTRGYLHMLLHCLYLHCFPDPGMDPVRWNLACDIAVELVIEGERVWDLALPENHLRTKILRKFAGRAVSAQQIYRQLSEGDFLQEEPGMAEAFAFDEHDLWYEQRDTVGRSKTRQKWEKLMAYTGAQRQDHRKKAGVQKGDYEDQIIVPDRSRFDYRKFLKQFSIPREEVELDLESFDYIFYDLGMRLYGDMPLIEPLEYQEVNRLEELVIAIDTSGSCSREVVQQFLAETWSMLSNRENFFRKMKVYLIQCDCCVQDVMVIHSEEEWKAYSRDIRIQGRGGTDFRPVFDYVEELRRKKELRHLKALIYFTDGDGVYPRVKPEYETAFVFLQETPKAALAPDWAQKLFLGGAGSAS